MMFRKIKNNLLFEYAILLLFVFAIGGVLYGGKEYLNDRKVAQKCHTAFTEEWAINFFSVYSWTSAYDLSVARIQFLIDNNCTASLEEFQQTQEGKEDLMAWKRTYAQNLTFKLLFEKQRECANNKETALQYLDYYYDTVTPFFFDIFYSQKTKTCVYIYALDSTSNSNEKHGAFVLADYPTKETIAFLGFDDSSDDLSKHLKNVSRLFGELVARHRYNDFVDFIWDDNDGRGVSDEVFE